MSANLKISFEEFVRHRDNRLTSFEPPCKIRKQTEIEQSMFDYAVFDFIQVLNANVELSINDDKVYTSIIHPVQQRLYQIDKSECKKMTIYVYSKRSFGWEFMIDDKTFTMCIPSKFVIQYADKLYVTYRHNIAVCFYVYLLKKVFRNKYDIQDYYEYEGPWSTTTGGDGYKIDLFYK